MESRRGSTDPRISPITVRSVLRQMVEAKSKQLFLLLCYVAVLIPTATGQVLCLDCCCADQIQTEPQACCCCAEPEPPEPVCCAEERRTTEGSGPLVFACPTCDCTFVPYSPDTPQLAEKTDSRPMAAPGTAAAFSPHLASDSPVILCPPSSRTQTDTGRLRTVILLI